jgi:hypothetical protein
MIKIAVLVALILVAVHPLHGQIVSPLHQVMASNSMLNRPKVFREMQANLKKEYGEVKPGVRLDLFYKKMSDVRGALLDMIDAPAISFVDDSVLTLEFVKASAAVKFPQKMPSVILAHVEEKMAGLINDRIDAVFRALLPASKQKDAIISAWLEMLAEAGLARGGPFRFTLEGYSGKLAQRLAAFLIKELQDELARNFPDLDLFKEYAGTEELRDFFESSFNQAAENLADQVRERLAQALDKAEHEVAKAIDEFSKRLITGNIGLAVSEGEGAFAGGVLVSFTQGASFQGGVYVNAQLSKSEGRMPAQSLLGVQLRLSNNRLQSDFLFSGLFGDRNFDAFEVGEGGTGASWRASNKIILGLAYFSLFAKKLRTVHTLGATFKGTSPGSPALLLGATMEGKKRRPIFQISFPVAIK